AGAVEAALLAERQVRVERERIVRLHVGRGEPLAVVGVADALVELDRGGIRGVAWSRAIEPGQELGHAGAGLGAHAVLASLSRRGSALIRFFSRARPRSRP